MSNKDGSDRARRMEWYNISISHFITVGLPASFRNRTQAVDRKKDTQLKNRGLPNCKYEYSYANFGILEPNIPIVHYLPLYQHNNTGLDLRNTIHCANMLLTNYATYIKCVCITGKVKFIDILKYI